MSLIRFRKLALILLVVSLAVGCSEATGPGQESQSQKTDKTMNTVETGSKAPEFALSDQSGNLVRLSGLTGKSNLVLFFYPKDESYGCTREACSFRDQYEEFTEAGAVVIGISSDGVDSHKSFAARHNLPYLLLSDPAGKVAAVYGVKKSLGVLPGRVTFVIDRQGIVRMVFSSQLNFGKHITEALNVLKGLH